MSTVATAEPSVSPGRRVGRGRWFFIAVAVAAAVTIFFGFAPTYYLKPLYGTQALSGLLHLHGALFTSWIVLLVAQVSLVAARRTDVHRRLGVAGGVLAGVMTVLAYLVSVDAARRGSTIPGMSPAAFLAIPLATVVVFPSLVGAALWFRRRPDIHKRLMIISTAELLPAGIGRLPAMANAGPLGFFGGADLLVVLTAVYDLAVLGRVHRATLWGGLFLIGSQVVRVLVTGTAGWSSFAGWLVN